MQNNEAELAARETAPMQPAQGEQARRRQLILAACLMASFMAAVESTIIATAMPTIVGALGGFTLFSWVFAIYLLTQAVSIPVYGRLADLYGRKPVFLVGAGLFLCGSTLCGFSWGMLPLICFRALQGFGAGAVQPISATILGDIYPPTERGKIQGLVSSVFGISALAGPSLGAFLVERVSWQAVFWVNIPIGFMAMAMIASFLKEEVKRRQHRIDWLGSLLLLVMMSALIFVLVQGPSLSRAALATGACVALAALALLLLHERRTPEPMLPLELWRNRIIAVGSLGSCAAGAVMMGVAAFLPAYVQGVMGRSAFMGGAVLGAMQITWALSSLGGAWLMNRTSYRFVAILGAFALIAGCAILVALTPERGPLWATVGSLMIGTGMGSCNTVFIVAIQASVPWTQRGAATSSAMFLRFIGQAMGAAGCGAVLNAALAGSAPNASHLVDKLLDMSLRNSMNPAQVASLTSMVAHGLRGTYLLTEVFALCALVFTLYLPARLSPRRHL